MKVEKGRKEGRKEGKKEGGKKGRKEVGKEGRKKERDKEIKRKQIFLHYNGTPIAFEFLFWPTPKAETSVTNAQLS